MLVPTRQLSKINSFCWILKDVILFPLRPASCRTQRTIDRFENDFLLQYPVRGIFVSGLIAGYTKAQDFQFWTPFFDSRTHDFSQDESQNSPKPFVTKLLSFSNRL